MTVEETVTKAVMSVVSSLRLKSEVNIIATCGFSNTCDVATINTIDAYFGWLKALPNNELHLRCSEIFDS